MSACPACGGPVSVDAERTTTRLLASLDPERRGLLEATYQEEKAPERLCSACMNTTVSALNQAMGSKNGLSSQP